MYKHTYIKHFNLLENQKRIFKKKEKSTSIKSGLMFMTSFHKRHRAAWWEGPGGRGLVGAAASRCCPAVSRYFLRMLPVTLPSLGSVITLECLLFSAFSRPLSATQRRQNRRWRCSPSGRRGGGGTFSGREERKQRGGGRGGTGGLLASGVKGQGPLKQHFGRLKLTAITSRTHSHTLRLTQRQNGPDSSGSTN